MKNMKRTAAIIAVVVLLIVFCLPMIFAMGSSELANSLFRVSIGMVIIVPVLAYAFLLVYKVWGPGKNKFQEHQVDNIIFDVGKVLVDFEWEEYLASFGYPDEVYQKLAEIIFEGEIWEERDKGLLKEEEYIQQMVDCAPEYEKEIREVMERSYETITLRDYSVAWIKYLKEQGYKLYILSNYSEHLFEHTAKEQLIFRKYMDGEIFSYTVGDIKPNESIYRTLLKRFHLNPAKSVFIDDRLVNCESARRVGIHTVWFKDFKQAVNELKKYGI